jgi:uncharacterized membrane protein
MKLILSAMLAIVAQVALSSAALADISVCNSFRTRVRVAFAYEDSNGFHAAGWWAVDPNACRNVDFPFQGSILYYTAESDSYREGRKTFHNTWGNEKELFVPRKDFNFDYADHRRRGAKATMFSLARVSEQLQSKPIEITLSFTSGSTSVSMKSKANPKPNPKPAATAAADISICNDFRARVRVALAYEGSSGFHAAGWWAVEPNACRDVDFPFRGSVLYYAAESDYREGDKSLHEHWGNKKELYVGSKDFDLEDAGQSRPGTKPAMFSLTTVSAQLQSKPIVITLRFTSDGTTINMKAR